MQKLESRLCVCAGGEVGETFSESRLCVVQVERWEERFHTKLCLVLVERWQKVFVLCRSREQAVHVRRWSGGRRLARQDRGLGSTRLTPQQRPALLRRVERCLSGKHEDVRCAVCSFVVHAHRQLVFKLAFSGLASYAHLLAELLACVPVTPVCWPVPHQLLCQ